MLTSAERFFSKLNSYTALEALIGTPEDADFDCKEWSPRSDANRGSIAKAACGFTNATGGVLVIGVKATGRGADTPDVVRSLEPVSNRKAVASEALDIVLKFVEPGIEGVKMKTISVSGNDSSGFVIIFVPSSDGALKRSKVDWRFYIRIASGTLPMEYFQVEERFGRRPLPRLALHLEVLEMKEHSGLIRAPLRHLVFGLRNDGRGIAKFPGVRFKRASGLRRDDAGIDGNCGFGLPPRPSESEWIVFRGGVDDVIYPGETRLIGRLIQMAENRGDRGITPAGRLVGFVEAERLWVCDGIMLECEIYSEGTVTQIVDYQLIPSELRLTFRVR